MGIVLDDTCAEGQMNRGLVKWPEIFKHRRSSDINKVEIETNGKKEQESEKQES